MKITKKALLIIVGISLMLFSCSSTREMVSPVAWDGNLSLGEKLSYFGGKEIQVDHPETYFDGKDWLERMTELVKQAKDYILVSTFLGSSSKDIEEFYDALVERAEDGVRVYVIIDGSSSYDMTETQFYMTPLYYLKNTKVNLLEYSPYTGMHIINPMSLISRDHRKLLVIDGLYSALGGMNINYISLGAPKGETQRDSMYLFSSAPLASALIDEFVSIWNDSSMDEIKREDFSVPVSGGDSSYTAWLFNASRKNGVKLSGMYGALFAEAKESVLLLPYLPVLDKDMKRAIKETVDRGVDFRMLFPMDLRGYASKGLSFELPSLLESTGITATLSIRNRETEELLPLLHEKLMIVDSRYVVLGSANFNYRSMGLSNEIALLIDSPELAGELASHVDSIIELSGESLDLDRAEELKREGSNPFAYLFLYFGG